MQWNQLFRDSVDGPLDDEGFLCRKDCVADFDGEEGGDDEGEERIPRVIPSQQHETRKLLRKEIVMKTFS